MNKHFDINTVQTIIHPKREAKNLPKTFVLSTMA